MAGETIEDADSRWPLLPVMLGAIGLATGIASHWIIGSGYQADIGAWRVALLSLVGVTAILFGFVAVRGGLARAALFALACGTVAALILYFNGPTSRWGASEAWRLFSLALAIGIAAPLFQAWREAGFKAIPYAAAHDHAWTNAVLWCLSWVFVGVVMLMIFLLAGLFDLIGLRFLSDLVQKEWFWRPVVGLAFGLGLALLREHSRIVRMLQNVAMLVLGVLAPVMAVGLGLFLLALPFTGLQPLWDATKATTPILLTCAAGALLLVNAVVGNGGDEAPRNRVLRWAAWVLSLTMLPLVVIAQIATALRIGQYGFTPERLWALTFVILATLVAVAYFVCIVRGRRAWMERVRPANLHLAMISCGIALLLATPVVSFNAISTRDQVARLESGKVTPDKFDWAALAFDFGEPGRRALERLKASRNPVIARTAADVAKKESRWAIDMVEPDPGLKLAGLDKRLRILPRAVPLPDELREALVEPQACGPNSDTPCTLLYTEGASRAMLFNDNCYRKLPEPVAGERLPFVPARCSDPVHLASTAGKWEVIAPNDVLSLSAAQRKAIEDGFRGGAIEVRPVQRRQVFVGGVPVGDPFE